MNDKIILDVRTIEQRFFKTIVQELKESYIFEEKA